MATAVADDVMVGAFRSIVIDLSFVVMSLVFPAVSIWRTLIWPAT